MANGFRNSMLLGIAAVAIVAPAAPAYAQSLEARREFNIPAQSVADALLAFSRQSNIQIVTASADLGARRSKAVRGSLTPRAALDRLLEGSGLNWRQTSPGSIVVGPASPGEADAGSAAAGDGSAEAGAGIAEILVVGNPSQNVDIARNEDDPQPYVVFNREEIQHSQATNLEEFFRTRLPQNTQLQSSATGSGIDGRAPNALGNTSQINLRGLGTNQTLVLVDGRRLPRVISSTNSDFTQGDLNGIPLSSIERIEVLPSTAGGIYGGGAVGGVVNIIRRRDYRGVELRASYQGTFRGGGESYQLDLSGGFALGSRTRISFSGSWSDTRPLYADDNDLWRRGRELFVANDPVQSPIAGYLPNIRSVNGVNLVLDNGTPLNSAFTYIPAGYQGAQAAADGGRALVANAGQYDLELSNDAQGRRLSLRSNPLVRTVNVNVRHEFADWLDAFADFTYGENIGRSTYSGLLTATRINANAPNNPFQQDITVTFPLTGTEQPARVETKALATTAGLIVRPFRNWSATLEYGFSRSRTTNDLVGQPVQTTINTAIQTGALDVMRDLNQYPLDYTAYLPFRPVGSPLETRQEIFSARVSGSIVELPGGPLALTALAEKRTEIAAPTRTLISPTVTTYRPERSQTNEAAYAEVRIPLISERNALSFAAALELQMSIRHDRYQTVSPNPATASLTSPNTQLPAFQRVENKFSSTDYTVAVRWAPVRDIAFRASYATGFLPASISQLVGRDNPNPVRFQLFTDPRRGNQVNAALPYLVRTGGNADLLPEQSRSFSFGAVVTPTFLPAFRFSADYSSIRKTNEIVAPSDADIVANEALFPGRVVRGPNLPTDQPGWAGPITFIDRTLVNFARTRADSVDFQADYEVTSARFGTFRAYALATYQLRLRRQLLATTAAYDLVDSFEGPLKWRGNGGIDWRQGGWRAGWNMQFFNSYSILFGDPSLAVVSANQLILQGGSTRIPSQTYHDVYVGYDFPGEHPLAGMRASLGIQNLLDHRPPVIASPIGGYSRYGDPRLRRFTLSIAQSF